MTVWSLYRVNSNSLIKSIGCHYFGHLFWGIVIPILCFTATVFANDLSKPNIIIIVTDDQGYGDLGCFGHPTLKTPHIDQMAREGCKLTSFYVAAPVCTPSRAALMTGCYAPRVSMGVGSRHAVLLSADSKGLNPSEITIAEVLKGQGYTTGMFGKWHLGDQKPFLPKSQGFDTFYGIPYSHDIHPFNLKGGKPKFGPLPLLNGEKVIELDPDADQLTKNLTEKAVEFIEQHQKKPFFLYLPHPIPHRPLHISDEFQKTIPENLKEKLAKEKENTVDYITRDQLWHWAIEEIDWSVGQVLKTLRRLKLDKNTIVLFTSDNGHSKAGLGSAKPFRGTKGTVLEGGMRVPTVLWAPGKIPENSENDEILATIDLLPTFAKLAGGQAPRDRVIDGLDIWPNLIDPERDSPHRYYFYYKGDRLRAVRRNHWKLHLSAKKMAATELYNLSTDKEENRNVIAANRALALEMAKAAKKFDQQLKKDVREAAFVKNPRPLRPEK